MALSKVRYPLVFLTLAATVAAAPSFAQSPNVAVPPIRTTIREYETRAELEAAVSAAEKQKRQSEAWLLRSRLQRGDFQEGDRIVVVLDNSVRIDTMVVRQGRVLQFVGMADLSLDGVLRSELNDRLRQHLGKYLVNPGVRVVPLIPIAVLGSIANPGYYYVPADALLRDVVTMAGGPRGGDLKRMTVRRGNETIWKSADLRIAMADGLSVDRLHLRAGDELNIPTPTKFSISTIITTASAATTLYFIFAGRR